MQQRIQIFGHCSMNSQMAAAYHFSTCSCCGISAAPPASPSSNAKQQGCNGTGLITDVLLYVISLPRMTYPNVLCSEQV
jgi:hypothetical protein